MAISQIFNVIIVPVLVGLLGYFLNKNIFGLKKDVLEIKDFFQMQKKDDELIEELRQVKNYYAGNQQNQEIKLAMIEKDDKFISISAKVFRDKKFNDMNYFQILKNQYDSGNKLIEELFTDRLDSVIDTQDFFVLYNVQYSYFLQNLKHLFLSAYNKKNIRFVDECKNFMSKYHEIMQEIEHY